jgi:hypothetical protein
MKSEDGKPMHCILRSFFRLMLMACCALAISACDSGRKEPPPDLLKSQRQSMERARDVEKTLQQSSERRREEVDRADK